MACALELPKEVYKGEDGRWYKPWVHKMVNMSKQQYTQEEFIEMCTAVSNKVKW